MSPTFSWAVYISCRFESKKTLWWETCVQTNDCRETEPLWSVNVCVSLLKLCCISRQTEKSLIRHGHRLHNHSAKSTVHVGRVIANLHLLKLRRREGESHQGARESLQVEKRKLSPCFPLLPCALPSSYLPLPPHTDPASLCGAVLQTPIFLWHECSLRELVQHYYCMHAFFISAAPCTFAESFQSKNVPPVMSDLNKADLIWAGKVHSLLHDDSQF